MGLKIGLAALDTGRMGIAAQAVGIAQAALEEGLLYAKQRRQFKVPICNHQAIQMMIAGHGNPGGSIASYDLSRRRRS